MGPKMSEMCYRGGMAANTPTCTLVQSHCKKERSMHNALLSSYLENL